MKRNFSVPDKIPKEVGKMIKIMNSTSGQYVDGTQIESMRHEILDLDAYIHITSPIRRVVDILNMIKIQQLMGMDQLSEEAYKFYNDWVNNIDYINTTTRAIRKVQNECSLLDVCSNNPEIMEKEYNGYITEKNTKDNGLFQYSVFLPELKMSALISTTENFEVFDCKKFKLFLFNNEAKFKRKIRIHMV
jgi:exoribonuclease R